MNKLFISLVAILTLTACVTPLSAEQQVPTLTLAGNPTTASFVEASEDSSTAAANSKALIAVADSRPRTLEGKPENMVGYLRVYGIPNNWTVNQLQVKDLPKDATVADLIGSRMSQALTDAGLPTTPTSVDDVAEHADEVSSVLDAEGADKLISVVLNEWHVDVNTSWVGKFQFNHDADVTVYDHTGKVFEKNFAEREVIQGEASNSWANMVLAAFRDQMQQILSDSDLQAALLSSGVDEQSAPSSEEAAAASPEMESGTEDPAT